MRPWGAAALAVLLVLVTAPPADAEHCRTGISIYGRHSLTPGVVPPPTARICVAVETSASAGHVLPPATDQVFVRVEADLGGAYPMLQLRLDGLGFRDQVYPLWRTQGVTGVHSYDLKEWLYLPDDDAAGPLRATVRFPGGHEAVAEYRVLSLPASRTAGIAAP